MDDHWDVMVIGTGLGGVPSAMHSGRQAARYLLEGAGAVGEMAIPGSPPS